MSTKSAFSTLQVILIIDLIVVASAAAGYFYVSSLPAPALTSSQIQLTGMKVTPSTALAGESIQVSINVTNIGGESGTYMLNLILDGTQNQAQSILLAGGETKTAEFSINGASEGTHVVGIDNLQGGFILTSKVELSDLAVNRTEAQVGEAVGITVKVTNNAQDVESYSFTLTINNSPFQTKTGQLNAGQSTNILFEVVEQTVGTYTFKVGTLEGNFSVTIQAEPPKPAEFQVKDLAIDPGVATPGTTVTVSAKVTNVGEVSGTYTADFSVSGQVSGTKTVQLSGGETATVSFTITENVKGTYRVSIGDATGSFTVQDPARIELTNFAISPDEVWGGQTFTVSVRASNTGSSVSSLELKLKVDSEVVETRTVRLAAGTFVPVSFTATAPALPAGDSASYIIDLNGIRGTLTVVKDGFHTLTVDISPSGDADFSITSPSGVVEPHVTPYSALKPVGSYTVTMPAADPTGKATFLFWEDRSTATSKSFTLSSKVYLVAVYSRASSCPSIFMYNGTDYVYVSDVSNHGWLGYTRYVNSDGSLEYWRNNPWDYVKLNNSQLAITNGYFDLNLTQKWNEIFYIDSAYMLAVDHPVGQSVYSTMVEQYIDPNYMGKIYTVSNNAQKPVSATNEIVTVNNGAVTGSSGRTDALAQISKMDGIYTTGYNGKYSQAWNNQTWNRLTLDLGNQTRASQIKLVVKALVDWGPAESYTLWMDKFYSSTVPDHTEPTPTPYMEVKDAKGNWVRVPESRQFPLPPDGVARTYVVDLTGLFPTNDYSLRISNFWNVTYDYVGVDTSLQQNTTIQRLDAQAILRQEFVPDTANSAGNFTRYGTVTNLVRAEDDMFVIGRQGDSVSLHFPTSALAAPAPGMERDYFLFVACWFKVEYANYGFGPGHQGFTVDPLPFHYMSGFPYPLQTESYPFDAAHNQYLQEYNTRIIAPK